MHDDSRGPPLPAMMDVCRGLRHALACLPEQYLRAAVDGHQQHS